MPVSTVWILKYAQQYYVKWFWTISSLGAPAIFFVSSKTVSKLGMRISRALSVMRMSRQLSVGSYQQWLRALTICIENSKISVRIQIERFISLEIFQMKGTPSEVLAFPTFTETIQETIEIYYTLAWITSAKSAMLPFEKKWTTAFCKWYNSIPFLFN